MFVCLENRVLKSVGTEKLPERFAAAEVSAGVSTPACWGGSVAVLLSDA